MRTLGVAAVLAVAGPALADPCGMVPPIYNGPGPAISRVGAQRTYVFFKDGVETFVIRPGFTGRVDNFGMLIPFPSPPAIRKVPDDIFEHIAAAIDPPEVIVDLYPYEMEEMSMADDGGGGGGGGGGLRYDTVRVLKQEAVGMYEIAVLEAGSPAALKRWMDRNGFTYPNGMDRAVGDYVHAGWAFVAVKTNVGSKPQVSPRPGMRGADAKLPAGANFDGSVQAMGFRFRVKEPVVPMRLSTYNDGELHNIVYYLSDEPVRINGISTADIKRQVDGGELFGNVTKPLPMRIIGGSAADISKADLDYYNRQRNPDPHNGHAKRLFASDLLAVKSGQLTLDFEEDEKVLLRIGEALDLRGPALDALHHDALAERRDRRLAKALRNLQPMTLSIVDGNFPKKLLQKTNLTFTRFEMTPKRNRRRLYDAVRQAPHQPDGELYEDDPKTKWWQFWK